MKAPVAAAVAPSIEKADSTSPVPEPDVLVAPFFSVIAALDNKKKYLEARAEKLRKFDEEAKLGKKLTEDKEKARLCLPDVKNQIGFIDTIQKKVMEKQREFNKKTKQRNYTSKQENGQICGKVAIEALSARYVLGQYLGADQDSKLVKSFTSEEKSNLKTIARFFLPELFPTRPATRFSAFIDKHKVDIDTVLSRKTNYYLWEDFNGNDAYRLLEKLTKVVDTLEEQGVSVQKSSRLGSNSDDAETPFSSSPAEPDLKAPAPSNTPVELAYAPEDPKHLQNGDSKITFGYFSDNSSRQSTPPSPPLESKRAETTKKPAVADGEKPEIGEKSERKRSQRRPRTHRKSKTSESAVNGAETEPKKKTERLSHANGEEKTSAAPRSKGAPRGGNHNNGQRRPREHRENGTGDKQANVNENGTQASKKTAENGTRVPRKTYNDENGTRAPRYNKNYQGTSSVQKNGYYKDYNNGYAGRGYARENSYRNDYNVPEGYVRRGDYVRPVDSSTCGFTLKVQH